MGMYDMFKDTISIAQKADNIELVKSIMNLQEEMLKLQEENRNLKDENQKLENIMEEAKKKEFRDNCYYFDDEGPFCSKCYDDERKKIRMLTRDNNLGSIYHICPKCKTEVYAGESDQTVSISDAINELYS